MQHYYVSIQASDGDHVVHVPRCTHLPEPDQRIYLGAFTDCRDALTAAMSRYENSNGCSWCCSACHSG